MNYTAEEMMIMNKVLIQQIAQQSQIIAQLQQELAAAKKESEEKPE